MAPPSPRPTLPPVTRKIASLRKQITAWRQAGDTIALVPTMGALHQGHLALVQSARKKADRVVVSIFVNPIQFGPSEDLSSYPRDEKDDRSKLAIHNVDLVFAPDVEEMFAGDFSTRVQVSELSDFLCGASRPGHFTGMATIVAKLLLQTLPDIAIFGEKDFQQLAIIRRMVRDLNIPVKILGHPLIREKSGLALSSRNRYFNEQEKLIAPELYASLRRAADALKQGGAKKENEIEAILAAARAQLIESGFRVDYLELRDSDSLQVIENLAAYKRKGGKAGARPKARLFVAAFLGKTRLIDNLALTFPAQKSRSKK